jgi:acetaldehyde dehydrogenase
MMRNTVYVVPEGDFDEDEVVESVNKMVAAVQEYVPGYHLKSEPFFDEKETPWGKKRIIVLLIEVEGAGDFLPRYAGNLDIMTSSARGVGEQFARHLLQTREVVA